MSRDSENAVDSSTRSPNRRRSHRFAWLAVLFIAIAAVCCVLLVYCMPLPVAGPSLNVLLLGEDRNYSGPATAMPGTARTDTIILMSVPKRGHGVTIISIPRDTLVKFPNGATHRINAAMVTGGIDLVKECVANLTGMDVHKHLIVDFESFVDIVDAIGGVEIDVSKRMRYHDRAGGYSLDLEPGTYVMDGELALKYVRYRNDALGDIARTSRQQQFLKAMLRKLATWDGLRSFGAISRTVREHTSTDLTARDIMAIGWRFRRLGATEVSSLTLPGHFQGPYWEPDRRGIEAMVESLYSSK